MNSLHTVLGILNSDNIYNGREEMTALINVAFWNNLEWIYKIFLLVFWNNLVASFQSFQYSNYLY